MPGFNYNASFYFVNGIHADGLTQVEEVIYNIALAISDGPKGIICFSLTSTHTIIL